MFILNLDCVCYSAEAFCKVSAVCWSGGILPLVLRSFTHYLYLAEDIAMLDEALPCWIRESRSMHPAKPMVNDAV